MKKAVSITLTVVLLLSLCLTAVFLTACDNKNETGTTYTDLAGRQITLDTDKIDKVVCIGAGSLRLYSYVADMNKLCAVEDVEKTRVTGRITYRAYQIANEELFRSLPSAGVGGPQAQLVNTEKLIDLAPDVVFSCLTMTSDEIEAAEKAIGCPIVTLRYGEQKAFSQQILDSITLVGKIMKCETRAKEITDYMTALKADIAAKAAGKTSAKVYLACNSNWGMKGFLSTSKNYPLFTLSGITNVMDDEAYTLTNGNADLESVIASDADKIILDAGGLEIFKGEYEEENSLYPQALASMDAFAAKEVYLMMPNNAYDANVETYFINAYYALTVAFADVEIDIEAKANEITRKFLGKDLYDDIVTYGGYQKLDLPDVWPTK